MAMNALMSTALMPSPAAARRSCVPEEKHPARLAHCSSASNSGPWYAPETIFSIRFCVETFAPWLSSTSACVSRMAPNAPASMLMMLFPGLRHRFGSLVMRSLFSR